MKREDKVKVIWELGIFPHSIRSFFVNGTNVLQQNKRFSEGKLLVVNMERLKGVGLLRK